MPVRHLPLVLVALLTGLSSCRGRVSESPPIHLVLDMDFQAKLKPQSESKFPGWDDHRGMRLPVQGTIARGSLGQHSADPAVARLHTYKDATGKYLSNPLPKTRDVLLAGKKAYDINCAACHGLSGRGNGLVASRLPVQPPSFLDKAGKKIAAERDDRLDERVQKSADGEVFEVITNGKGTMQPYRHQVPVEARWSIVHYIRALQLRVKN